jgi:acetylornithine deacetylase/succinyl-diaminopimelate desuccinylase-like protein
MAYSGVPVLEVGLENTTLHKVNEFAPVNSLLNLRRIYTHIFKRLLSR